jgi:hypothetical protein
MRIHPFLPVILLLTAHTATAQTKAQACFFSADFNDGSIPSGWDIGPEVEMQDPLGNGLGTHVPAWTVGSAAEANSNGYFPVPNVPFGDRFLMVNDDASPCNCDLSDVAVTTPVIDLTERTGVVLEARVFHEGLFGAGPATVEVQVDGGEWTVLHTVADVAGQWQRLAVDFSAYDGQPQVRIRFRWSDGGGWASGFAVDDICLRERLPRDLSVVRVHAHDITASPFTTGDQGLGYTLLPLEQAAPMTVSAVLRNSGIDTLFAIGTTATITLNGTDHGPFAGMVIDTLPPGAEVIATIDTDWSPDATGPLTVTVEATVADDDDPTDNIGVAERTITGPGWDDQYGAMAVDAGTSVGTIGGHTPFMAVNRFELVQPGSRPHGITAHLAGGTMAGAVVRAVIMDDQFAVVDTSARHTITAEEEAAFWVGVPLHLPFDDANALAAGDYHVGIQLLDGTDLPMYLHVSGTVPTGASVVLEGTQFLVDYVRTAPMVRLHLAPVAVGVRDIESPDLALHAYPVPTSGPLTVRFTLPRTDRVTVRVLDALGRPVGIAQEAVLPAGTHTMQLDLQRWNDGIYVVEVVTSGAAQRRAVVLAH